jgi:hypothetical protein
MIGPPGGRYCVRSRLQRLLSARIIGQRRRRCKDDGLYRGANGRPEHRDVNLGTVGRNRFIALLRARRRNALRLFAPYTVQILGYRLPNAVIARLDRQSSNPRAVVVAETSPHRKSGGYWIARSSRAMTSLGMSPR